MDRIWISLLLASLLLSCNNENGNTKPIIAEPEPVRSCYQSIHDRDTVTMSYHVINDSISGMLTYKLFEKDQNAGQFTGKISGDFIIARYRFFSEGRQSEREIAFKKQGNKLVEGFGEVKEENGVMVFVNRDSLQYNSSITLNKISCNN